MTEHREGPTRRASDERFQRGRAEFAAALEGLLGARVAPAPLADADAAAAIAAESRAAHRAAEQEGWALVRCAWSADERESVAALLHAIGAYVGARPTWLVVPGREPQAVALTSDMVLDNPLGFAALAEFELVLLDQRVPAGLWLGRHAHPVGDGTARYAWELEVYGAEPWLSAATRAIREQGRARPSAG